MKTCMGKTHGCFDVLRLLSSLIYSLSAAIGLHWVSSACGCPCGCDVCCCIHCGVEE